MAQPKLIHTSYFANASVLPVGIPQISIARWAPPYWKPGTGRRYERRLAPSKQVFDMAKAPGCTHERWSTQFIRELEAKNCIHQVYRSLPDRCILLCWEKDWDECHRKLVWEFLRDKCGAAGGEWVNGEVAKEAETELPGLFDSAKCC